MEECSELLHSVNVRLFGDRSSKVRCSPAQSTRKIIVDMEDELLENIAISENDQREIDNFKSMYRFFKSFIIFHFKVGKKKRNIDQLVFISLLFFMMTLF